MDTKKHIRELLSVYLDQRCSQEEKKAVEAHLSGCVECRQELEDLQKTIKLITSLKEIEPPDNLWEGVANRIQKKSFWEIIVLPRFSGVAVATVTILLLAVTVNKYSTRVVEQTKARVPQKAISNVSMPLVTPFVTPKPFTPSIEKKTAARSEGIMVPVAETAQYKEESLDKAAPQESSGMTPVSQPHSSFSTIEMEVQDIRQSMQRLEELAQNHQAQRISQSDDNGALFYQVHQQKLDGFVRDLNKVGKVSQHEAEYERLKVSPASGGLGTGASSQPKLIQIKFNSSK